MATEDSSPPQSELVPPPLQTWVSRILEARWLNRFAGLVLLAAVATGSAYLVTPGLNGQGVRYVDASVGLVARSTL